MTWSNGQIRRKRCNPLLRCRFISPFTLKMCILGSIPKRRKGCCRRLGAVQAVFPPTIGFPRIHMYKYLLIEIGR